MTFYRRSTSFAWALLCAAALAVAGCHKNNDAVPSVTPSPSAGASTSASPSGSPSPSPAPSLAPGTATTSFSLVPTGGSVTLSTNGVAGTLIYAASTAGASSSGAFTLTTIAPTIPSPAPTGTGSVYFTVQFSTTIGFQSGFIVSPVVLPSSLPTTGVTYVETIYDQTTGASVGTPATASVTGQSLAFAASGGAFSAAAGNVYVIVISAY